MRLYDGCQNRICSAKGPIILRTTLLLSEFRILGLEIYVFSFFLKKKCFLCLEFGWGRGWVGFLFWSCFRVWGWGIDFWGTGEGAEAPAGL